jgi:hypothetical protein
LRGRVRVRVREWVKVTAGFNLGLGLGLGIGPGSGLRVRVRDQDWGQGRKLRLKLSYRGRCLGLPIQFSNRSPFNLFWESSLVINWFPKVLEILRSKTLYNTGQTCGYTGVGFSTVMFHILLIKVVRLN